MQFRLLGRMLLGVGLALHAETNAVVRAPGREAIVTTPAEREVWLGWWREARFGMFVHWGVYSPLSGTWNGRAYGRYGEPIQRMAKIPIPVYRREVAGTFNPVHFNADKWMRLAKEAGMDNFIITAKHHDGFAMYDSQVSDDNIVKATPFARDPMKELQAACRKHGLKFGFYYSHAFDWGEENRPGNDWDFDNPGGDKLLHGPDWWNRFPELLPKAWKYVDEKSIPQILELIRNYDPDLLWFGSGEKNNDTAQNWVTTNDAVVWSLRLNDKATFELALNHDAPATSKSKRLVEGEASKEVAPAHQGAGGKYVPQFAGKDVSGTVRQDSRVTTTVGTLTLDPGSYQRRIAAVEITGQELMRLRNIALKPVRR